MNNDQKMEYKQGVHVDDQRYSRHFRGDRYGADPAHIWAEVRSTDLPSMLTVPRYLYLPPASSGHKCTVSQFGTMTKSDKVEIDIVPISKKACVHEQELPRSARTDTKSLPSSKNIKRGT